MYENNISVLSIADLLRQTANDLEGYSLGLPNAIDRFRKIVNVEKQISYEKDLINLLVIIADKVEHELEAARREAVREAKKPMWWFQCAIKRGEDWPEPRDDETFREYLNRCFILRPRDESGEPVQFGESDVEWIDKRKNSVSTSRWDATGVDCLGRLLATSFNQILAVANTDSSGRVKRLSNKVRGIDGLPIFKGQTVWLAPEFKRFAGKSGQTENIGYGLCGVKPDNPLTVKQIDNEYQVRFDNSADSWCLASWLTHTEPDTQERIDRDALKDYCTYWNCTNAHCCECPLLVDGENPSARYGTRNCDDAKMLDLLRRQRELYDCKMKV